MVLREQGTRARKQGRGTQHHRAYKEEKLDRKVDKKAERETKAGCKWQED